VLSQNELIVTKISIQKKEKKRNIDIFML